MSEATTVNQSPILHTTSNWGVHTYRIGGSDGPQLRVGQRVRLTAAGGAQFVRTLVAVLQHRHIYDHGHEYSFMDPEPGLPLYPWAPPVPLARCDLIAIEILEEPEPDSDVCEGSLSATDCNAAEAEG